MMKNIKSIKRLKVAAGRILMVQESRFRLATEGGQTLLLTLNSRASVDETDLIALHGSNSRIAVEYEGEPNMGSGIVHSITMTNQTQ